MTLWERLYFWWFRRDQDRLIRRHGWNAVYVGDYHTAPTWAYTVGFDETLDHPELIVFDIPMPNASSLFWEVFDDLRAGSLKIEDGLVWPPDSEVTGVWREVHPSHLDEWLKLACMRRFDRTGSREGLRAFQFVLSDRGVMPWQEGYDEALRERQPLLFEPAISAERPA